MKKHDKKIRYGFNYTPSKNWYYCWNDWDADSISADFAAIAALGADHIRVMLIWQYFQPNPTHISQTHLSRLKELMKIAAQHNLDVVVTPLTGFLSGYVYLPSRVNRPDVFLNRDVIQQEKEYLKAVVDATSDFENLLAIDLGNEINCLHHTLSYNDGDKWAEEINEFLKQTGLKAEIVNGVDHQPWVKGSTFSPATLTRLYDIITLHCWSPFTGCLKRGNFDDLPSIHLQAFMALWAKAFDLTNQQKNVWVQEFGTADIWASEEQQKKYLKKSIPLAIQAGVTRFTFWCSHDLPAHMTFQQLEYRLGLLTGNNQPKPLASVYKKMIQSDYEKPTQPNSADIVLVIPDNFIPNENRTAPQNTHWTEEALYTDFWVAFELYLKYIEQGKKPIIMQKPQAEKYNLPSEIITGLVGR